ncbi:MAG: SRPBCC family protein [Actinobacteria bacterium]|nr:SRPBCC family protein [Actinomycetota bacterium]
MIRLHEIRQVLKPRPQVFAYAADLANTEQWNPNVVSAREVGTAEPGIGARYQLEVSLGGVLFPMIYEVSEYEPDYRVTLLGRSSGLHVVDELKFLEDGDKTVIDYTANLSFRNFARFVGPLTAPVIRRAAARSVDALVAALEG